MRRRPERLMVFDCRPWGDDTLIEAVFIDHGIPIVFRARLPFEDREYFADIFSTNEASAEYFSSEELLDACFCAGHMTPENKEHTDETQALVKQCVEPSESNDGV